MHVLKVARGFEMWDLLKMAIEHGTSLIAVGSSDLKGTLEFVMLHVSAYM